MAEVKTEGFDMLSKECIALQGKNSAMEGDAWVLSFTDAENRLLQGECGREFERDVKRKAVGKGEKVFGK